MNYGINLRQEIVSDYQNPFLFSLNSSYKVAKNYIININGSKNHRVPTFNDLYWSGAGASGNLAMNVQDVSQYGMELGFDWKRKWGNQELVWESEYAYTKSIDNTTKNQLLYVPEHMLRSNLAYQYKKLVAFYQFLYNGSVYTTTDNSDSLSSYTVGNIGLDYHWPNISGIKFILGLKVNNLFNKNYQNVAYRPMPNRNFQLQLITKF